MFNVRRLKRSFPDFFDGSAILWVYNPAMIEYIEKIPHRLLVYDCVDDYPSMANYARLGLSEEIARREGEVTTRADVVFTTTRRLAQKLSQYNNNVHYVGNAGDYERFAPVGKARAKENPPDSPTFEVGSQETSKVFLGRVGGCGGWGIGGV